MALSEHLPAAEQATDVAAPRSLAYAWYIVLLCMVAYVISQIDRYVIVLLIEPIRADLQISDTQFSLVHGLAFAIFYGLMGIPIARLADSRSRPLIIAAGIFLWSLATAACGAAKTFGQLFMARMAVGFGEAALSPAAYSMIADSFPRSRLGVALGVYSVGAFIGSGLAFLIGGTVIDLISRIGTVTLPVIGLVKPWQMTFFMVGLPGVLLAALFRLTVRDPERKGLDAPGAAGGRAFPLRDIGRYIARHRRTFAAHYLGFAFLSLSLFSLLGWAPAFLIRNYGLSASEVGMYLGVLVLVSNTSGVLSAGWLTDHLTRRGYRDAPLRAAVIGACCALLPGATFSSMKGLEATLLVLALAMYFCSFPMTTSAAALQMMAPNRMRAQVTALFFLAMNIIGVTGGATLVALCTDYLFRQERHVGYSMSINCAAASLTGAILLALGLRHFRAMVR
jgi:MFS family permease